jgi:hypothetical protein
MDPTFDTVAPTATHKDPFQAIPFPFLPTKGFVIDGVQLIPSELVMIVSGLLVSDPTATQRAPFQATCCASKVESEELFH